MKKISLIIAILLLHFGVLAGNNSSSSYEECERFTNLMTLFGQSKAYVLEELVPYVSITQAEGGIEVIEFWGYKVILENDKVTQLEFFLEDGAEKYKYSMEIFNKTPLNGSWFTDRLSPEMFVRFVGHPASSETSEEYDTDNASWRTFTHDYWLDKELILKSENETIFNLIIKSRRAATLLLNSQQYNYSPGNIAYFFTKTSVNMMTNYLGQAEFVQDNEEVSKDFYYMSKGFSLTFNEPYHQFEFATFFGQYEGIAKYALPLPYDLNIDMTPAEVKAKLGEPGNSGTENGLDKLVYGDQGLIFAFAEGTEVLVFFQLYHNSRSFMLENY